MTDLRKYAFCVLTVFAVMILWPHVSYSEGLQAYSGKELLRERDDKGAEPAAASKERFKDGEKTSGQGRGAASVEAEKDDAAQEDQDQDIMEQALALLQVSQEYWVKGDVESALEALDQAYALILDTNGEPDIARQKDDLRLLISKRILAVYSAMQTVTPGKKSEVPLTINADVEKEIRSFQNFERDFFISSYQRSHLYRPMILRELKKFGLPEELSWLPLVESGFKIAALSRARALGLWQFIPSTGYKYDLNRDDWIDERLDAEKSTRAAIAYLRELHAMFGDWLTVLAAYNCGEGRVMRVISRQHINYLDRFWDLYHLLPNETARYVPRFLATLHIIKDPAKYGMDLTNGSPKPVPLAYKVVQTSKPMRLQDIALHLNAPEESLNALNSELRFKVTPEKPYALKVPPDAAEKFAALENQIPRWEKPVPRPSYKGRPVMISHRVRKGETVSSVARKYRTSPKVIRSCNHLAQRRESLKAGQYLTIPIGSAKAALKKTSTEERATAVNTPIRYKVKKGDTLASIANRYNVTTSEIREMNRLKSGGLKSGQVIRLPANRGEIANHGSSERRKANVNERKGQVRATKEKTQGKTYVVRKGDSLYRIASNHSIKVQRLRELNHLPRQDAALRAGQVLHLE